jgi:D-alanyl-D-alanine dipeptidase
MKNPDLVKLSDYGLLGQNYHWAERTKFHISKAELQEISIGDIDGWVSKELIDPLKKANELFHQHGYELFVTDAYRSPELYKLAYKKRLKTEGKTATDGLMSMDRMPHATGLTVDVTLLSKKNGQPVELRDKADGHKAKFINYYKDKDDDQSKLFQERQELLRQVMQQVGFKLGKKKEFWHFELDEQA